LKAVKAKYNNTLVPLKADFMAERSLKDNIIEETN
jgi:hypothetical protein